MNSLPNRKPTQLHQMTFSSGFFMNFTSNTTTYLGFFNTKRKRLQDKLCLVEFLYPQKHLGILFHIFYSNKIELTFIFECREIIYTAILASRENLWNHFCNFMPFRNYNICKYRWKKKRSAFLVFTAWLRNLPCIFHIKCP